MPTVFFQVFCQARIQSI